MVTLPQPLMLIAATFTGLVDGDDVTVSATGTFDNKNVGTGKTVTLVETNAGDDVGNYSITDQGTTTANITAKTLTATASASNKVYDGTTTAAVTLTFTGLVGDETLGQTVGATFADKDVANAKTVTVNSITLSDDGGLADNYTISTGQTTTANITPKALTIAGITASNKTYNGNTTATIDVSAATFSGLVDGDDVTVSATGTFDNKNVGTGKTVTLVETNAGDDVGNYSITDQGTTTANITQLSSVTWNGNAGDGLWSSANNWAGSAIPDQNNVATAVIPSDESVTFDSDTVGTIGSTITNSGTLTFNGATDYTFGQVISGSGALVKSNTNTLTLSATNTFTGDLTISAGTVTVSGTLHDDVDVINSGTYDVDSTDTINSLRGSGAVELNTGITLTTGDAGDDTISGVISGAGNLTKVGSGTLTLSNTNTYSGDTTISAGTIKLTGSVNALTDLSIASGATLDLQSTQTFATLDLDGTISNSAGSSELTITGTSDLGGINYHFRNTRLRRSYNINR
jgi:autotransporter-associated beta strand protein